MVGRREEAGMTKPERPWHVTMYGDRSHKELEDDTHRDMAQMKQDEKRLLAEQDRADRLRRDAARLEELKTEAQGDPQRLEDLVAQEAQADPGFADGWAPGRDVPTNDHLLYEANDSDFIAKAMGTAVDSIRKSVTMNVKEMKERGFISDDSQYAPYIHQATLDDITPAVSLPANGDQAAATPSNDGAAIAADPSAIDDASVAASATPAAESHGDAVTTPAVADDQSGGLDAAPATPEASTALADPGVDISDTASAPPSVPPADDLAAASEPIAADDPYADPSADETAAGSSDDPGDIS